jgi:hypothetical protein
MVGASWRPVFIDLDLALITADKHHPRGLLWTVKAGTCARKVSAQEERRSRKAKKKGQPKLPRGDTRAETYWVKPLRLGLE